MAYSVECPRCNRQWYIPEAERDATNQCPFCHKGLQQDDITTKKKVESRTGPRFDTEQAQVWLKGSRFLDFLKKSEASMHRVENISSGGINLWIDTEEFEMGTERIIIEGIVFEDRDSKKRYVSTDIKLKCLLKWQNLDQGRDQVRVGLQFMDTTADQEDMIAQIVNHLKEKAN